VKVPRKGRRVKNSDWAPESARPRGRPGRGSVAVLGLHEYAQTLGIFDVAVQIVELLAIDLGFGEEDVPLMALLLALVVALGALLRSR
jgi:hypothetical protein